MKLKEIVTEKSSLWIFGYGSLVWKPDFKFSRSKIGYINGYSRKFWHGDTFHRGNKETVMKCMCVFQACTWGVGYEVHGTQIEESLRYLNIRESSLGGYVTELVEFYPRGEDEAVLALVYIATSDNPIYLGPASSEEIAAQIAMSSGKTGHNIEYLVRLAEFMRLYCPEVEDDHLFSIETAIIAIAMLPYLINKKRSMPVF
ncbi:glutathione-specific gamma-glutamylcyclotransferase 1-like [Acipenser oxyrinchus oxyrinchus]|uniref:Gamma-glutamylcyclotransferase n=1 Tax=Acipenser oxyrinchus oxyrinchus TaxID=40147 RepID=A0AAD8CXL4_ACIOX|nr:glutathione-specific gamma-glutamylcyclotransferase 1-like [Acipenser oxyrinchus oxyrinchus]